MARGSEAAFVPDWADLLSESLLMMALLLAAAAPLAAELLPVAAP